MFGISKTALWAPLILFSLWPASVRAEPAVGGDPCAKSETSALSSGDSRLRIERDAAIDIVKHTQKACILIAELTRSDATRADTFSAIVNRLNGEILEYIYREYPDLRGKDLTRTQSPAANNPNEPAQRIDAAPPVMGPVTATYLRWAFRDIQESFPKTVGRRFCSSSAQADLCIQTIVDITVELGFAGDSAYKSFPDLWRLASRESAARADAPPRTAENDRKFRNAQPKVGSVKLSAAAVKQIRDFLASSQREMGPTCQIATLMWSTSDQRKGPNDVSWTKLPPGVDLGAYGCRQIPIDAVQTIDGIHIVFGGNAAERFEGKLVDFDGKQFSLKDQ